MAFSWKNSFQIISPIRWQMGDEVWKPTDVQFYIFIYSQRVLFYPENILVDYVCRFGFNLWILDFIDFCETTSDRHFLYIGENKVPSFWNLGSIQLRSTLPFTKFFTCFHGVFMPGDKCLIGIFKNWKYTFKYVFPLFTNIYYSPWYHGTV